MKVIVGLGNPGDEYKKNRHNAGKFFLDALGQTWNTELDSKVRVGKEAVWLIFPDEFMNKSGPALKKFFGKLRTSPKPTDLLVIHDDLDIDLGRAKLTYGRGSGGHKGVESIIRALKTKKFWRLRIGVAPRTVAQKKKVKKDEGKDYLLSDFSPAEQKILAKQKKKVLESIELWTQNSDKAQMLINQK